jgi:hypothetical protein
VTVDPRLAELAQRTPNFGFLLEHETVLVGYGAAAESMVLPLKRAEHRWAPYMDDPSALWGDALLHTDLNALNLLINGTARITDWAGPTRGAAWIDPACFILRLMAAGHTPREAEAWARQASSLDPMPETDIDAFAAASVKVWVEIAQADPQPWTKRLADVAEQWAALPFLVISQIRGHNMTASATTDLPTE